MNLCIIPARAGSKRIPKKNTRSFLGRPIIEYPLDAANYSNLFQQIIISTDDDYIAENYSAYVPFLRSSEAATDTATLTDVVLDVLTHYNQYDKICVILPTAVFTQPFDLLSAYNKLEDGIDSVVPVCPYEHPIERAFYRDDGLLYMLNPDSAMTRTQDLTPQYHDAGQFYWLNYNAFMEHRKFFMPRTVPYIMRAVDIDTESDWRRAEAIIGHA